MSDDGSIQDDVIALKVPSLIEKLKENLRIARARLDRYEESVEEEALRAGGRKVKE